MNQGSLFVFYNGRGYNVEFNVHSENEVCTKCGNQTPGIRLEGLKIEDEQTYEVVKPGTYFDRIVKRTQEAYLEVLHASASHEEQNRKTYDDQCPKCDFSYQRMTEEQARDFSGVSEQLDQELETKLREVDRDNW